VIRNSERYRKAAVMCRKKAAASPTPADWRGYANDWDRMAELADLCEKESGLASFVESAIQAVSLDRKQNVQR